MLKRRQFDPGPSQPTLFLETCVAERLDKGQSGQMFFFLFVNQPHLIGKGSGLPVCEQYSLL